jgi:hypothetical protein
VEDNVSDVGDIPVAKPSALQIIRIRMRQVRLFELLI